MLLHVDGLNKSWDGMNMPSSDYEGSLGEFEYDNFPLALQRLFSPEEIRAYDLSKMVGSAMVRRDEMDDDNTEFGSDGTRYVCDLSLNYFRGKLVEHFDILFKAGRIRWPKSRGKTIESSIDRVI